PFVQTCDDGEIRWIDVPEDGSGDAADEPAPALLLTAADPAAPTTAVATTTPPATTVPSQTTAPDTSAGALGSDTTAVPAPDGTDDQTGTGTPDASVISTVVDDDGGDDDGSSAAVVVVVVVIVVALLAGGLAYLLRRRR